MKSGARHRLGRVRRALADVVDPRDAAVLRRLFVEVALEHVAAGRRERAARELWAIVADAPAGPMLVSEFTDELERLQRAALQLIEPGRRPAYLDALERRLDELETAGTAL